MDKWWVYKKAEDTGKFNISPSGFSAFITEPWNWYRKQVLEEDIPTIFGDQKESSTIGTIIHRIAEVIANGGDITKKDIEEYLSSFKDNELDKELVREAYPKMAEALVNDYVLKNKHRILQTESVKKFEFLNGYTVGGTIDAIEGSIYYLNNEGLRISKIEYEKQGGAIEYRDVYVVDYKTYNSKTKPKKIPKHYKFQLLCYAYILYKLGYNPKGIKLVYVNREIIGGISQKTLRKLKDYPSEVTVLQETINKEDLDFIESILIMCAETHKLSVEHPEYRWLLYKDNRLKQIKGER